VANSNFRQVLELAIESTLDPKLKDALTTLRDLGEAGELSGEQIGEMLDAMARSRELEGTAEAYRQAGASLRELASAQRDGVATVKEWQAAEAASGAALADKRKELEQAEATLKSYQDGSHGLLGTTEQIDAVMREAKQSVAGLRQEVRKAEQANRSDAAALEKARAALARTSDQRERALGNVRRYGAELKNAGVDVTRLGSEEKRLASETEKAEAKLSVMAATLRENARIAEEYAKSTERAANNQVSFGDALDKAKTQLAAAVAATYGAQRMLSNAASAASEFQVALAAISTISPKADLDALAASVRNLSKEYGGTAASQAKALYEIIAAGVEDTASALKVLETANKLSIGGLADVQVAASGLVATLNSYGLSAENATRISDAFFVSAAAGNTTIEELAKNIGNVAPLAASVGLSIEELAAAIGALTAGGLSTSQAMTQVQSLLTAVVKPTSEAGKMADKLGIAFDTAAIRAQGFTNWIAGVAKAAGGSETTLAQLFGRVEGLQGVLSLTGNQAAAFAGALDDMRNGAGRTEEAFKKLADGPAQAAARYDAALSDMQLSLGNAVTAFAPLLEAMTGALNAFNALPEPIRVTGAGLAGLVAFVTPLALAVRTLSPVIAVLGKSLPVMGAGAAGAAASVGLLNRAAQGLGVTLAAGFALDQTIAAYNAIKDLVEINERVAAAEREIIETRDRQRAQIDQIKAAYGELADLQLRSADQLERMTSSNLTAYTSQLDAAAQYWRAIEIEAKRAGDAQSQAFARERAQAYAAALDDVRQRLTRLKTEAVDAGDAVRMSLEEAFKALKLTSQRELDETASNARAALEAISDAAKRGEAERSDVRRAFEGWADAARKAASESGPAAQAVVEAQIRAREAVLGLRDAHTSVGEAAKAALREQIAAMEASRAEAMRTANTIGDQLRRAQQQAFPPEIVSGLRDRLKESSAEADALTQAINKANAELKGMGAGGGDASGRVKAATDQMATGFVNVEKVANTADKAIAEMGQGAGGAAAGIRDVLAGIEQSVSSLGEAAKAEFDQLIHAMSGGDGVIETSGLTMARALQRVADAAEVVISKHTLAQEAAARHAAAMAYLQEHSEEAGEALYRMGFTVDDLRNGTITASDAMRALGNQRMDRLRPELEGVAGALERIDDVATSATARLAEMNREYEKAEQQRAGNERAVAELEHKERLREIDELARAAGAAGAAEAAEARRREEAAHAARLREIEAEKRAKIEADREADRQRRSTPPSEDAPNSSAGRGTNSGLGGGAAPAAGQQTVVHRVEIPFGGQTFGINVGSASDANMLRNFIAQLMRSAANAGQGGGTFR
jgi:TP901 family phage tail tape measure protein